MPDSGHKQNRKLWNEIADVHYYHPGYKVKEFLQGQCPLKSLELSALGDVTGKKLLHLFCHFGKDSLAWSRRGAIVTGVDISDRSIELANLLKNDAHLKAEFVRSDVLELIGKIDDRFDIIIQTYGTHCWISDLDRWAEVVAHYLLKGGTFLIVDIHPMSNVMLEEGLSYFDTEPQRYAGEKDYCDREYTIEEDSVEYPHTLADMINALIRAGLTIEQVEEYNKLCYAREEDWNEKDGYYYPPDGPTPYPLMFLIKAKG
ncbi:MAG: class I SAM-dependent methyltransferase [candidate division Zixibacteria bacterium]|nr:class I SAM-dependent methyltransferase [candidate division Zixibacteria bacterium]